MVRVNFSKTGWIREILAYGADFKFGPRHVAVTVASGLARGRVMIRGPRAGGWRPLWQRPLSTHESPNFILASLS